MNNQHIERLKKLAEAGDHGAVEALNSDAFKEGTPHQIILGGREFSAELEELHVPRFATEKEVQSIRFCFKLKELCLEGVRFSDLSFIKDLKDLQRLLLSGSNVEDIGHLRGLTNLNLLDLDKTSVRDIEPISELPKLRYLDIDDTFVNNLSPLASLSNLEFLHTSLNNVEDLTPLKRLEKLEMICAESTPICEEDVEIFIQNSASYGVQVIV